jgi:hypothetical protein
MIRARLKIVDKDKIEMIRDNERCDTKTLAKMFRRYWWSLIDRKDFEELYEKYLRFLRIESGN